MVKVVSKHGDFSKQIINTAHFFSKLGPTLSPVKKVTFFDK